ncbi:uncharacterized protein LOC133824625 [Humulus lupulus]|uniref:uncharacterized protein LOC133824625 n=1 Tax=Humulus lupulus TaxID=3486 RepID=UPI002B40B5CA|nr:uncharacterized protein LOC133824625 [Humulus lupulus]
MTWAEFQQAFNDKYYNVVVRASKVDGFATLTQGNMMVTEYALKFDRLAKFAEDLVPTNATGVDQFVRGLKPMIARDVEIVSVGEIEHMLRCWKRLALLREWKTEFGRKMLLKERQERTPPKVITLMIRKGREVTRQGSQAKIRGAEIIREIIAMVAGNGSGTQSAINVRSSTKANAGQTCVMVVVDGRKLYVDLIELDMTDFDAILWIDWLTKYNTTIDCKKKMVVFKPDGEEPFLFMGTTTVLRIPIISTLEAGKMLQHGCMRFLASVVNTVEMGTQRPEDTRIVRDYLDVFPEDLHGLPPQREIKFTIELAPEIAPISKAPYRMAHAELKELKV